MYVSFNIFYNSNPKTISVCDTRGSESDKQEAYTKGGWIMRSRFFSEKNKNNISYQLVH